MESAHPYAEGRSIHSPKQAAQQGLGSTTLPHRCYAREEKSKHLTSPPNQSTLRTAAFSHPSPPFLFLSPLSFVIILSQLSPSCSLLFSSLHLLLCTNAWHPLQHGLPFPTSLFILFIPFNCITTFFFFFFSCVQVCRHQVLVRPPAAAASRSLRIRLSSALMVASSQPSCFCSWSMYRLTSWYMLSALSR